MRVPHVLALSSLLASLPGQGLTLLEGAAPTALDVRVLDENNPTGTGTLLLTGVQILDIERAGRTADEELRADIARRTVRNGFIRIELPGGGRLFRYQRSAGQMFGFLLVPADGLASVLFETAALPGFLDPFLDRIGIAPDGRHAVLPLTNGGFRVAKLDGSTFASTGTATRFVALANTIDPASVMVGRSQVFLATEDDRVFRCAIADGGLPVDCTPPLGPNDRLKPELALSGDGSTVAFLAGPQNLYRIWLLRETGTAAMLPPPASKYEEPNYLPENAGHPHLLLNHDASRLFYVDAAVRDELHLLDTSGVLPDLQITESAIFQPYIGIHILPSFRGTRLVAAIGDLNRMDWFSAELNGNGGQVVNLTGTGSLAQPFPAGTIDPLLAGSLGNGAILATEVTAGGLQLRQIDPTTATSTVLGSVSESPVAGSAFTGAPDLLVRSAQHRLFVGNTGALLATTPVGIMLTPPARGPVLSATWVHIVGDFGIPTFYLPDGTIFTSNIEQGIRQLVMTQAGGCFVNGNALLYVAPGVFAPLPRPAAAVRWCISGAGG
ncbi:MAG: hypothetical protein IPK26_10210 [Planctomycetes bacterium]|nr:hypothetical protein [Planctomycetota bacterium]